MPLKTPSFTSENGVRGGSKLNRRVNGMNTDKNMFCENGRKSVNIFKYGDIPPENVDSFDSLGVTFYKNGNLNRTQKYIAEHGSYALHNLYRILSNICLNIPKKFK